MSFTSAQTLRPLRSSLASMILDIELSKSLVGKRPIDTIRFVDDILKGIF